MGSIRPVSRQFRSTLALLAASAALGACQPAPDEEAGNADANAVDLNLPAAVPLPEPPMGRSDLLAAVVKAASATAAGRDDARGQASLDGRQFELRIRFGCRGPAPELADSVLGWAIDRSGRTLRVRAMPTISADDPIVEQVMAEVNGGRFEAVEGFWIPRPWMLDPVCPATTAVQPAPSEEEGQANAVAVAVEDAQESQAPPPAWPKVGIARFFTAEDPRTRRRQMRPYEAVETIDPNQPSPAQGFNLVLSGRLRAFPGRKVIACVSSGPDNPPQCIISADFDRVWIERPDSREILAEWGSG